MTVEDLAYKTGLSGQMIRKYAKRIDPYCFERGKAKDFQGEELERLLAVLPNKKNGLSRTRVEKENGITPYIGRMVADQLGILNQKGGKALIPDELVPEFVRLAKQIKPKMKPRINLEDYYKKQYQILCEKGRMRLNEFLSKFGQNYTSIYDRLDKLNLLFYIDTEKRTKYIYPLRPDVEKWKQENRHIIKNGCMGPVGRNI